MIAIEHVLCPVDFSPTSRHALDHAVALACWFGARISVLYVHRPTMPMFVAAPVPLPPTDVPMDEQERLSILEGMARFVETDRAAGTPIELVLRESSRVAATIVDVAEELNVDVITMGTEGRSGVRRLLLGSVTEGVLRLSKRPVLTVTPRLPDVVPPALGSLDRIVCAVDWSPNGHAALRRAAALSEAASARLTVAHIVHLPLELVTPGSTLADQRLMKFRECHRRLETLIEAEASRCSVDPILLAGSPSAEINRLALEQQAGLLVIGSHGRGVVDAMLRGTTTEQVVRQAPCPVLTVRA